MQSAHTQQNVRKALEGSHISLCKPLKSHLFLNLPTWGIMFTTRYKSQSGTVTPSSIESYTSCKTDPIWHNFVKILHKSNQAHSLMSTCYSHCCENARLLLAKVLGDLIDITISAYVAATLRHAEIRRSTKGNSHCFSACQIFIQVWYSCGDVYGFHIPVESKSSG